MQGGGSVLNPAKTSQTDLALALYNAPLIASSDVQDNARAIAYRDHR
jgi:hypothetical protein